MNLSWNGHRCNDGQYIASAFADDFEMVYQRTGQVDVAGLAWILYLIRLLRVALNFCWHHYVMI